ncbi:MAG: PEGA domain-containing protein [Candidatus Riflebacteria bacterium]|nr:PEGA domain-containing protein [Candidatus Riflebacteria bacterium]
MKSAFVCLFAALMSAAPVSAALSLSVTSDREAKVYLGDTYLGLTPLTVSAIAPGTFALRVESVDTGEVKTFNLVSTHVADTQKSIEVRFNPVVQAEPPRPSPPVRVYRERAYVPSPTYYPSVCYPSHAAPSYYGYSRGVPVHGGYDPYCGRNRSLNRFRNVLLGAGLANEVFNRGRSRGDLRRGILGATLFSELVRGGRGW